MRRDYDQLCAASADPETIVALIEQDARELAGCPNDMSHRARMYRELYQQSGHNFIFPLIAAHGAVWGCWYLLSGRLAARVLNLVDYSAYPSFKRVASFDRFINEIQVINRDVWVECYVAFHLTRTLGRHAAVSARLSDEIIELLMHLHVVTRNGELLSVEDQRKIYESFFRHEQERVAAPAIERAFAELQWPYIGKICRQPWVWFAYFRYGKSLNFRDFAVAEERIEKGLIAFDRAAALGWSSIESLLIKNPLYPGSIQYWVHCVWCFLRGTPWSELNQRVREVHVRY